MNYCVNCGKETKNPKFCNKSCSAIWTNKHYPKRKTKKKCIICGESVISYRYNRCKTHWEEHKKSLSRTKTIGEYRNKESIKNKHRSWIHSYVRNFAKTWLKHLTKLPCANCGYIKHVELAHIIPLSSFPDNTLLEQVNSENNVIQLCPNCHWEFDNGLLKLETILNNK